MNDCHSDVSPVNNSDSVTSYITYAQTTRAVIFLSFRTDRSWKTVQTQIRPRGAVWSGSTLFAIPSASFGCITLRKRHLVQLLGWLQPIFWVSKYLGNLRRNDPKISDRYVWANSADPDETAPDQGLHCLPFRLHRLDSLLYGRAT